MLKNWLVKTQQKKTVTTHINYLKNKNKPSHYFTDIQILLDNSKGIIDAIEDRKQYRRDNSLRGGGVKNEATSMIISLPRDIKQPTPKEWSQMLHIVLTDVCKTINKDIDKQNKKELKKREDPDYKSKKSIQPNITFKELKAHCVAVLHDESASDDKPSHVHLILSNVMKNEVIKPISQIGVTYTAKKSINKAVKRVLGVDHMEYEPEKSKFDKNFKDKPLFAARAEIAEKAKQEVIEAQKAKEQAESEALEAEKRTARANTVYGKIKEKYSDLKTAFEDVKKDIPTWIKTINQNLFFAEKKSKSIAENLDLITDDMPTETAEIEAVIESIEERLKPSEPEKVTPKRQRRRRTGKPKG